MHLKIFFAANWDFIPKVTREVPAGAPGATEPCLRNKNGRNLNFFTGVSEFRSWARGTRWAAGDPGPWKLGTFWEFTGVLREFLRSVGAWILKLRTGRRAPSSGTYPQDIHRFFCIREFGSLK